MMMMMQRSPLLATVFLATGAIATAPHAQTQSDETPTSTFRPVTAERLVNAEGEPHNCHRPRCRDRSAVLAL